MALCLSCNRFGLDRGDMGRGGGCTRCCGVRGCDTFRAASGDEVYDTGKATEFETIFEVYDW